MKTNLLILIAMSFLLSACALPEKKDADLQKQVYDKVSEEFAICSAFYSIVSAEMEISGDKKSVKEANDAMENAFGVALDLARQHSTEEVASEVTWSRFKSSLEEMELKAGENFSNISILRSKHSERCNWVMTSPEELMKEKTREIQNKIDSPK